MIDKETIKFPISKHSKLQFGDICLCERRGVKYFCIILGTYYKMFKSGEEASYDEYQVLFPFYLNKDNANFIEEIKKSLPRRKSSIVSWFDLKELTFVRKMEEEEKIQFINEYLKTKYSDWEDLHNEAMAL